jgi:hypothetical protein
MNPADARPRPVMGKEVGALPSDRAVVNGAQEVSAVPASVPSAGEPWNSYAQQIAILVRDGHDEDAARYVRDVVDMDRNGTEARFWSIVDEGGLAAVPSDMWDALTRISRAARNRDMWKAQCERQAIALEAAQAIEARQGQDAQRLDRNDESAVAESHAPGEQP